MSQNLEENTSTAVQFLTGEALTNIKSADANPFIKISGPDKTIPFVVLADGDVIIDNTANNPKSILKNFNLAIAAGKQYGAGFMDIYYSNRILFFRPVESIIFEKKWQAYEVVSALREELNIYYPGYSIRSH